MGLPLTFYRKMNAAAVENALREGVVAMNAGERAYGGLVGVEYKPRLSPYFFLYQIPSDINVRTIEGSPFKVNLFPTRKSPATSQRNVLEGVNLIPISGGTLFKRINGKYEPVTDYDSELKLINGSLHKINMMNLPEGDLSLRPTENFLDSPILFKGYSRLKDTPYLFMNGDYASSILGKFSDPYDFLKQLDSYISKNGSADISKLALSDKMMEAARHNLVLMGFNPKDISDDMLLQYIQISLNLVGEGLSLLFHSTKFPFKTWDSKMIGRNTGNGGFYGRGMYFSLNPQESYGPWMQVMKFDPINVKDALLVGFKRDNVFYLPHTSDDKLNKLLDLTMKKTYEWNKDLKRYMPVSMHSPYPGMSEGNTDVEGYNRMVLQYPLILGFGDSKGGGSNGEIGDYYGGIPEIVVTNTGSDMLLPMFLNLKDLK